MSYTKEEMLYYWGSVEAVTDSLKEPNSNKWGLNHAKHFTPLHVGPDEVVIYDTGHSTIIAINGSDKDPQEWKGNLKGYPITQGMHCNFRASGIAVLNRVLRTAPHLRQDLHIVGHSRGGAIAQVMAHYLKKWEGIEASCITFGSPRVFTVWARPTFKHHRVFTVGDIVTRIPAVWVPPFFKSYQTTKTKIKTGRILGLKKKHGEYGEMISKYVTG